MNMKDEKKVIIGKVFDVNTLDFFKGFIEIRGDKITRVSGIEEEAFFKGLQVIDTGDRFLLPGLIDSHNHLYLNPGSFEAMSKATVPEMLSRMITNAKSHLHDGVTAIRDAGTPHFLDVELQKMMDNKVVDGPTLLTSGEWITASNGHGAFENCAQIADGVDEIRKAVRRILRSNVDFIKVMVTGGNATSWTDPSNSLYSYDELCALVEEAGLNDRLVGAHAHSESGARLAVKAGIKMIEHGSLITDDETIGFMKQNEVVWTFNQYHRLAPSDVRVPVYKQRRTLEGREASVIAVKKALDAGICVCTGCDGYHENSAMVDALDAMVRSGADNGQALLTGTLNPGKAFFNGERGILKAGAYADIIAVSDNPLNNINALRKIALVVHNGEICRNDLKQG